MFYLIVAVICSVSISILLRQLRQQQLDIRQTIFVGYPVAFVLAAILLHPTVAGFLALTQIASFNFINIAIILALGVLLPSVFIILGRAIETSGIIMADACQRLSLIIPIVASFTLFHEDIAHNTLVGIILGAFALIAIMYQPTTPYNHAASKRTRYGWLLGVWLGFGIIDVLFKQTSKQGNDFTLTLLFSFGLAAVVLGLYLWRQRIHWQAKAMRWGILLGILNICNIYSYIKAHQALADTPSTVFTGMNVGVIAVSSLIGFLGFKERLSAINLLGIVLAIACVMVLFWH